MEEVDLDNNLDNFEWSWYHTLSLLICNILYTLLLRSVAVFNYALSEELGITISMFSPVVVSCYLASIISPFIGNLNNKYTLNSVLLYKTYSVLAGIFGIVFGLAFAISQFKEIPSYSLIIYLTIVWLLFAVTQNIARFESYTLASQYNKNSLTHGQVRNILSGFSWSITSLFYIVQGYCIEYQASITFFGLGIMICIFPLTAMLLLPKYNNDNYTNSNDSNINLRLLLHYSWLKENSECFLIFIALIVVGIPSGSADVIFNPLYMHVYDMSTSESGICTLTIAFGEIVSSLFLTKYNHIDYFTLVALSIVCKLLCAVGFILLILFTDMNDGLTSTQIDYSVSVALSLVFFQFWFFGWSVFYVIQLIHVYQFVSTKENTSKSEFLLTINCCAAAGRSIGAIITPILWQYWDNKSIPLLIIALIWFAVLIIGIILYLKLHMMTHNGQIKQANQRAIDDDNRTQERDFLIDDN